MNNTFDFNRFSLLVKRQWVENKKLFLMASFGIMGILIVINSLIMKWEYGYFNDSGRFSIFLLSLFFGGSIFTNYVFKDISDKNSSTSFLLVPASHFEKFLTGVFYAFVVFPIVFLTLFYLIDFGFVSIGNNISEGLMATKGYRGTKNIQLHSFMMNSKSIREMSGQIVGFWLVIQAFVLAGAAQFEGRSYIKTAFMGFALLFLIAFVIYLSNKFLLSDITEQFQNKGYSRELVKPTKDMIGGILGIFLIYVLPPILLVTAYLKLKEKQV
jgi:glucan phosphoethanolaminetransferase (alkaline phosphatase superfamily)